MIVTSISLQNFRSYTKALFGFSARTTLIIGKNTAGKTNLLEAIYVLGTGKSFRAEKEKELILFNQQLARVSGTLTSNDTVNLELVLTKNSDDEQLSKKYLVNGVS